MRFYATLLDSFQDMLTGKWGMDEKQMIDRINRVPFTKTEEIYKGITFHSLTEKPLEEIARYQYDSNWIEYGMQTLKVGPVIEVMTARSGGIHEQYCHREIDTRFGPVMLYGVVDTQHPLLTQDLKTTKAYYDLRYMDAWQWKVYLFCTKSPEFEYVITDFENVYYENYFPYPHMEADLRKHAEHLCEFIEARRDLITDTKIFT